MGLVLVGLIIPTVGVFAGSGSGNSVAAWSTKHKVTTYQENSASVDWNGHWTRVSYRNYSGGRVRSTDQRGAGATVTFKGTGFAWVGPVGPTRGEAKIYVDGKYVKTVDMYASRYVASTVVFQQLFSGYGTHTFKMVSLATNGHPTVAVDKFIIRGNNKVAVEPVAAEVPAPTPDATAAAPTTTPTATPPTAAPTAVATPVPTPVATPVATPKPTAVPPSTSGPIVVTQNNVTIDGKTITGSGTGVGIKAYGTYSNPITNLTIRNCAIKGFNIGIDARFVKNLTIENCKIDDSGYAGIMVVSGVGGRIADNVIRKVAYYTPTNTAAENNAYGIALTRIASSNFTTNPRTSDFVVDGNTIEDVPYWHCLDTHAGQNITFSHNVTRRCPRPIFITTDAIATKPKNITATGNRLEQPLQVSAGTNLTAITLVNLQGGSITNNAVAAAYGTPYVYDYLGLDPSGSTGVTISGMTTIP